MIADVHGHAPALEAVLAEVEREQPDLIVFCGDLTWGPLPRETLTLLEPLRERASFVRGNAERDLVRFAAGELEPTERSTWLVEQHGREGLAFVESFASHVVVDVDGLGPTRFVHGSSSAGPSTTSTPPSSGSGRRRSRSSTSASCRSCSSRSAATRRSSTANPPSLQGDRWARYDPAALEGAPGPRAGLSPPRRTTAVLAPISSPPDDADTGPTEGGRRESRAASQAGEGARQGGPRR